jgi:hypothetical protein
MDKWVLAQLDPIKLCLIGLLIGHQQKAQTQKIIIIIIIKKKSPNTEKKKKKKKDSKRFWSFWRFQGYFSNFSKF